MPISSNRTEISLTSDQIEKIVELVENDYEYILIDSPAGIDNGFQTSIACANEAIVVVTPEVPSIRDADRVIGILMSKSIEKVNLVINRIRPNMVKTDDMMSIEDVTNILGVNLIGVIPDSEKIIIASNRGEPIVLEDKNCLPGVAFDTTARRLTGEEVNFMNFDNLGVKNPIKRIIRKFTNQSNFY